MKFIHKKTQRVLASKAKKATTTLERMVGLMFRKEFGNEFDGLLIEPCNSIHNCFVRFPIDVIFISKNNVVVKVIREFKPWRFTGIYFKSKKVLELPGGTLDFEIMVGDELEVSHV